MTSIKPAQYRSYEAAILSGQVPQCDVPALLTANPDFALWYVERATARGTIDRIGLDAPLKGCLALGAIVTIILGAGIFGIVQWVLA